MKPSSDCLMVASRLVEELGDGAARHAKCRLVELIAANNMRAASFWREVMRLCEEILDRHRSADMVVPSSGVRSPLERGFSAAD